MLSSLRSASMLKAFQYHVFLNHSLKDKTAVRELTDRLCEAELKVWFDERVRKLGVSNLSS
jgi:hypothetical protein